MAEANNHNGRFSGVPNEVVEKLAQLNLSPYETRVLWAVIRRTYGYSTDWGLVSVSLIGQITSLDRRNVSKAKRKLFDKRILISNQDSIGLNRRIDQWVSSESTPPDGLSSESTTPETQEEVPMPAELPPQVPYQDLVDLFNRTCGDLPRVKEMNATRRKTLGARWKEHPSMEFFSSYFVKAQASNFLSGRSKKWALCSFDWLIKPTNMTKVLEGNYDNERSENGYEKGRLPRKLQTIEERDAQRKAQSL